MGKKNLTTKENGRLTTIMKERVDLITEHINDERFEYAKIEVRALKKYLDCQIKIAKRRAKANQNESMIEVETESN